MTTKSTSKNNHEVIKLLNYLDYSKLSDVDINKIECFFINYNGKFTNNELDNLYDKNWISFLNKIKPHTIGNKTIKSLKYILKNNDYSKYLEYYITKNKSFLVKLNDMRKLDNKIANLVYKDLTDEIIYYDTNIFYFYHGHRWLNCDVSQNNHQNDIYTWLDTQMSNFIEPLLTKYRELTLEETFYGKNLRLTNNIATILLKIQDESLRKTIKTMVLDKIKKRGRIRKEIINKSLVCFENGVYDIGKNLFTTMLLEDFYQQNFVKINYEESDHIRLEKIESRLKKECVNYDLYIRLLGSFLKGDYSEYQLLETYMDGDDCDFIKDLLNVYRYILPVYNEIYQKLGLKDLDPPDVNIFIDYFHLIVRHYWKYNVFGMNHNNGLVQSHDDNLDNDQINDEEYVEIETHPLTNFEKDAVFVTDDLDTYENLMK